MGNLVIVESPAKAKTIQKFLGEDFVVKSSFGHIRDLQDKKLSVEVDNNFNAVYVVPDDKKKVVADLKKAAKAADIVWLASDEDREGEAISWHLSQVLELKEEKTRRIAFHEITKTAIQNAIANPRNIDINLVNAQQARRVLDRLVGFEVSPILWRKIQRGLSAGRVQSVALRLVVEKEKEIIAFVPSEYYRTEGQFSFNGSLVKGVLDTKFASLQLAHNYLEDIIGASHKVASIEKKESIRRPAAPFTTSTLQQEGVRKLHLSVSVIMRTAQSLYERGLITYMRTDSTNLSSLALASAKKYISEEFGSNYCQSRNYKTNTKGAQEAHEAIRPTYIANSDIEGTAIEKKLYKLIWKRTLASQMADAKVLNTNVKLANDKRSELFSLNATQVLFDGFMKLYTESRDDEANEESEAILPEIKKGDVFEALNITSQTKFTAASPRYSEATLVKKLEELGIGRPSTYAPTITTLTTARGYLTKGDKEGKECEINILSLKNGKISQSLKKEIVGSEKSKLLPQEIGMVVSDYLVENFPKIMDYDFTADVEKDFDEIAEGNRVWNSVIAEFYSGFHSKVDEVLNNGIYNKVEREIGIDPKSGEMLIARLGQYGPYIQKGDAEKKQFASLPSGMLIETITLDQALSLFGLPRTVGEYNGAIFVVNNGRFGPYLKYGDKNISLPKGTDPYTITLEQCISLATAKSSILEFSDDDIIVLKGMYGPYIKHAGKNYKIPKGTNPEELSLESCKQIIESQKKFNKK